MNRYAHQIIASINEETGGPAVSVALLNQALRTVGIQSHLHSIDYDQHGAVTDRSLGTFPRAGLITRLFRGWSQEFRSSLDAALTQNPGIVHNHGCWMMPNRDARSLAVKHQLPLIISPRGMLEPWAMQYHALKKKMAWVAYEKHNLTHASAFHATSISEAESLRRLGFTQPIYLIPNGVEIPDLHAAPPRPDSLSSALRQPFILFLSRLHPKKGLELLLPAWKAVMHDHPDVQLVIAGPDLDDYQRTLTRKFPEITSHPRVIWTGAVRGDHKKWLLQQALLMVLPTYSENFGQVVAESLAHRTPVLTTDRTPWSALNHQGCGWIISPSESELTEVLDHALRTPVHSLKEMGVRGQLWMQNDFSWQSIGKEMNAAYQHVTSGGPSPESLQN